MIPFTAALMFSSCDSTTALATITDEIDFNLEKRGIDFEAAMAAPGDIAELLTVGHRRHEMPPVT